VREIKVRVWTGKEYRYPPPLGEWDVEDCEMFAGYHKGCEHEQYTGLLDKNGREICEGDIVHFYEEMEVVKFEDGGFDPFCICGSECQACPEDVEVIGNIHEDTELVNA
jgi:hypothetical protein